MNKDYYASLPLADYIAICDTIRELLSLPADTKIVSGELANYVKQIADKYGG